MKSTPSPFHVSCLAPEHGSKHPKPHRHRRAVPAGARWNRCLGGGVSPLTPDHVNPERAWLQMEDLARLTEEAGFKLGERLTAHPHYVRAAEPWIDPRVLPQLRTLAGADRLAVEDRVSDGQPWREPDPDWSSAGTGSVNLHTEIDTAGDLGLELLPMSDQEVETHVGA